MKAFDIKPREIKMVEMAPPDVAGALAARAIDAFSMGEPFPSQAEIGGFGRVLFHAREYWPDYMSCVLVARQDMIDRRPDAVQVLVDGIARSGLWLEQGQRYRENAADFVGVTTTTRTCAAQLGAHQAAHQGHVFAACARKTISIWCAI
jgi:NitT/TauT family transport system substrate-binding protein